MELVLTTLEKVRYLSPTSRVLEISNGRGKKKRQSSETQIYINVLDFFLILAFL